MAEDMQFVVPGPDNYVTLEEVKAEPEYDEYRDVIANSSQSHLAQTLLSAKPNEHTTIHDMTYLYGAYERLLAPTDDNGEVMTVANLLLNPQNSGSVGDMQANHSTLIRNVRAMSYMFGKLYPVDNSLKKVVLDMCERMGYTLKGYFGVLYNLEVAKAESTGTAMSVLRASGLELIDFARANDLTDTQKVVRKFLELCAASFLRKDADIDEKDPNPTLYRPVFLEDGKTYVYSYERFMGMRQFIYTCTKRDPALWAAATKNAKVIPAVLREMKCTQEDLLPEIKENRHCWSYRNGVFDVNTCKFYYHHAPTAQDLSTADLDASEVCVHFIDQEMPYREMMDRCNTGQRDHQGKPVYDFRKIPTPTVERIMNTQEWSEDVRMWLYAFIFGRQFLPLRTKDQWEIYTLLMGEGGTGKSTLLKLYMMYFPIEKIGILNSDSRQGFPLQALYDKHAVVCTECGKLNLSTQKFCALTAAERMGIELLFKKDVSIDWTAPLLMAGNSPPDLSNEGDAVGRRTVGWLFKKIVPEMDPNLFKNLRNEMALVQLKGALLYEAIFQKFGHRDLWEGYSDERENVLPREFHRNRREIQAIGCPIAAFFDSDSVERGQDRHCTYGEFMARFDSFCEEWKVNERPSQTTWKSSLSRYNITIVDPRPDLKKKQAAQQADLEQGLEQPEANDDEDDKHHGYTQQYLKGVGLVGAHHTPAAEHMRSDGPPPKKKRRTA